MHLQKDNKSMISSSQDIFKEDVTSLNLQPVWSVVNTVTEALTVGGNLVVNMLTN